MQITLPTADEQLLILAIIGVCLTGLMFIGYWLLFQRRSGARIWQVKLKSKLKELNARNIDTKQLVMEYDKLLEYGLRQKYGVEASLGQILKLKVKKFAKEDLNQIWAAHKVRNKLAHDIDYKPKESELNKAMIVLKRAVHQLLSN